MRKIILFVIVTLLSANYIYSQNFEGSITYTTSIQPLKRLQQMGMTAQSIKDKMRADGSWTDSIKVYYDGKGNYCKEIFTYPKTWSVYNIDNNKIYTIQEEENSDICTIIDAAIDAEANDMFPVIEQLQTTTTINGIRCSAIKISWSKRSYTYYYNKDMLEINPDLFSKHNYQELAAFIKISGALPLQIVETNNGLINIIKTMKTITKGPVKESLFKVPTLKNDSILSQYDSGNRSYMRVIQ